MAKKISELPSASLPLTSGERFAIVQFGMTVQTAVSSLSSTGTAIPNNVAYKDVNNNFTTNQTIVGILSSNSLSLSGDFVIKSNATGSMVLGSNRSVTGTDNISIGSSVKGGGNRSIYVGSGVNANGSTTANDQIFIGTNAGERSITSTNPNIYIGGYSGSGSEGFPNSGTFNTFVGYQTGSKIATGSNNTFIGTGAAPSFQDGNNTICIGYNSGLDYISGNNNITIGQNSGSNFQTGSNNILLGANTGASFGQNSLSGCIVLGTNATCVSSNQLVLGSNVVPVLTSVSTALPATPTSYLSIRLNGQTLRIPVYI